MAEIIDNALEDGMKSAQRSHAVSRMEDQENKD
jgi:hypothetical protein